MTDDEKRTAIRIGMLRQWLNEDRITDPKRMVTNEDIIHWLTLDVENIIKNRKK